MNTLQYESIDESLYIESGEKAIVYVTSDVPYIDEMTAQNKRVLEYLKNK